MSSTKILNKSGPRIDPFLFPRSILHHLLKLWLPFENVPTRSFEQIYRIEREAIRT